jgi:hypothetical protein
VKSHQLAEALSTLAEALRAGPNLEVSRESLGSIFAGRVRSTDEIAVNLATLSAMARIQRAEWIAFVKEYQIPIDVRDKDASRDILGKLLRHLDENPEERTLLERRTAARSSNTSPELMKALNILLRNPGDRNP